jgi:hypothetical protein
VNAAATRHRWNDAAELLGQVADVEREVAAAL